MLSTENSLWKVTYILCNMSLGQFWANQLWTSCQSSYISAPFDHIAMISPDVACMSSERGGLMAGGGALMTATQVYIRRHYWRSHEPQNYQQSGPLHGINHQNIWKRGIHSFHQRSEIGPSFFRNAIIYDRLGQIIGPCLHPLPMFRWGFFPCQSQTGATTPENAPVTTHKILYNWEQYKMSHFHQRCFTT